MILKDIPSCFIAQYRLEQYIATFQHGLRSSANEENFQRLRKDDCLLLNQFAVFCLKIRKQVRKETVFDATRCLPRDNFFGVFDPDAHRSGLPELVQQDDEEYKKFRNASSWLSYEPLKIGETVKKPVIGIVHEISFRNFFCFALHEIGHILFHLDDLYERAGCCDRIGFIGPAQPLEEFEAWLFAKRMAKCFENKLLSPTQYKQIEHFIDGELDAIRREYKGGVLCFRQQFFDEPFSE